MSLLRLCDRCGRRVQVIGDFMPKWWQRVTLPATDRHKEHTAELCEFCLSDLHYLARRKVARDQWGNEITESAT